MPKFLNRKATERLATRADISLHEDLSTGNNTPLRAPVYQPPTRVNASEYTLKTPSKVKKHRLPGTIPWIKSLQLTQPDVLLIDGKQYHQNPNLPWVTKRTEFEADCEAPSDGTAGPEEGRSEKIYDQNEMIPNSGIHDIEENHSPAPKSRHCRKKENQCHSWINIVIPQLVPIIMERNSFRPSLYCPPKSIQCACKESTQSIIITCLYWNVITTIDVAVCPCRTIPELLVKNGFFPCSPTRPTLAIYTDILEFFHGLHAHQAPNVTAISQTFIDFFKKRKAMTMSVDSLRRRFAAALLWYSVLDNATKKYVDNIINENQTISQDLQSTPPNPSMSTNIPNIPLAASHDNPFISNHSPVPMFEQLPSEAEEIRSLESSRSGDAQLLPWPSPCDMLGSTLGRHQEEYIPGNIMSSQYLQSCCPCCFGGAFEGPIRLDECPSVIVQIDANFGQKRRHGKDDATVIHPYTKFLDQKSLDEMEAEVSRLRPPRKQQPDKRHQKNVTITEDRMEQTGLPTSVLDACEATFEAADSRREKASTQFFSDMGLMAILCRHDIVLFLANMKSAGEKQFYALSLIKAVFTNLPKCATIGVLYDIGCQLHRSIINWNFLEDFQQRMIFGLSIFHAYGHEWPCQLVYNPRKRQSFGLSNGEGCECLWSVLKELIPNLRVSGFYKRLFTLDNCIQSRHDYSLAKLGHWLHKTYIVAENKLYDNKKTLESLGLSENELETEWEAQIKAQTKVLPSQSKTRAQKIIETALRLRQELSQIEHELSGLQVERETLLNEDAQTLNISVLDELDSVIQDLSQRRTNVNKSYQNRLAALGASERDELQRLMRNEYLVLRMNLRAKKQRIRERLRRRKMELSTLAHSGAHSINRSKLVDHAEKMITRREPTILRLVSEYNKGCEHLDELIAHRRYPQGLVVVTPERIDPKRLFSLDMDDTLWQDVGLEDDSNEIPGWIGDDDVRKGIRAMLEKKRAEEEIERVKLEVTNMQSWLFRSAQKARQALAKDDHDKFITTVGDEVIDRIKHFLELFKQWSNDIAILPGYDHNLLQRLQNLVPPDLFQPVRPGEFSKRATARSPLMVVAEEGSDDSDVGSDGCEEDDDILDEFDFIAVEGERWEPSEFIEVPIQDSRKRPRPN